MPTIVRPCHACSSHCVHTVKYHGQNQVIVTCNLCGHTFKTRKDFIAATPKKGVRHNHVRR